MLNNDHFQRDATELDNLNDFDDTLTQAAPQRHDLFSKAQVAVREVSTMQHIQKLLHESDTCTIRIAGSIFARGDGQPDKPGTVRKVGTRRQCHRKQHWGIFSAK